MPDRNTSLNTLDSKDQQLLQRLTSILDEKLGDERFGVNELACEAGLSKSQLLRKLRSLAGKSSSRFIREYRLQKALELLKKDVGTAAEIAYSVGFSSPTYFSTCFHDYMGYPPREVRFRTNGSPHPVSRIRKIRYGTGPKKTGRAGKLTILLLLLGMGMVALGTYMLHAHRTEVFSPSAKQPYLESLEQKSIGVLPLINLSGDASFDVISEGITDALISRLSTLNSLEKVVPYTTMATYRESEKNIGDIAEELGVTHLLEGSVQRYGSILKIRLRLVNGEAQTSEWARDIRVAWDQEALFAIQSMVAEQLVLSLHATQGDFSKGYYVQHGLATRQVNQQASFIFW